MLHKVRCKGNLLIFVIFLFKTFQLFTKITTKDYGHIKVFESNLYFIWSKHKFRRPNSKLSVIFCLSKKLYFSAVKASSSKATEFTKIGYKVSSSIMNELWKKWNSVLLSFTNQCETNESVWLYVGLNDYSIFAASISSSSIWLQSISGHKLSICFDCGWL